MPRSGSQVTHFERYHIGAFPINKSIFVENAVESIIHRAASIGDRRHNPRPFRCRVSEIIVSAHAPLRSKLVCSPSTRPAHAAETLGNQAWAVFNAPFASPSTADAGRPVTPSFRSC